MAENTAAELVDASVAAGLPMGFLLHLEDQECYPAALPDGDVVGYILELYNPGTFGNGSPPEVQIKLLPSPTEDAAAAAAAAAASDPVLAAAVVSTAGQFDAVVYAAEEGARTALASMPGKPWPLRVEVLPGEPATGSVVLFGDDATAGVVAGSAVVGNITLRDEFGNELLPRHVDPLRSLLDLVVERAGGEEQEVPGYSGNTTTTFNVTMAGEVTMHVKLDGRRLPGGQGLLVAPAAPEPGRGVATGNVTTVQPRQEGQIHLSLLDAYGNEAALPAQLDCEASVALEPTPINIPAPASAAVSSCGPGIDPMMNNYVVIRFSIDPPNVTLAHLSIRLTGANGWEDAYSFSVEVADVGSLSGSASVGAGEKGEWEGLFNDESANPDEPKAGNGNTVGLAVGGVVAAVTVTALAGALYVWMGRRRASARGSLLSEFSDKDRAECGDEESLSSGRRSSDDDGNDSGGMDSSSLSTGLIKAGAAASDSHHQSSEAAVRGAVRGMLLKPSCDIIAERRKPDTMGPAAMEGAGQSGYISRREGGAEGEAPADASSSSRREAAEALGGCAASHAHPSQPHEQDSSSLLVNPSPVEVEEESRPAEAAIGKSTGDADAPADELSSRGSLSQHLLQLPRIPPLRLPQMSTAASSASEAPTLSADCPEVLINNLANGEPRDDATGRAATRRDYKDSSRTSSVLGEGSPLSLSLPQISPSSRSHRASASSEYSRDDSSAASARPYTPQSLSAGKQAPSSVADGGGSDTAAETLEDSREGWEGGPPVLALLEQMMPGHQASMGAAALAPGTRPPRHAQSLPPLGPRPKPRPKATSSAVAGEAALLTSGLPQPPSMPPSDAIKDRRSSVSSSSDATRTVPSSASSLGIPGQLPSQDSPPGTDPDPSSDGHQLPGPIGRPSPAAPAAMPSDAPSAGDHDGPNETTIMGAAENGRTVAAKGSSSLSTSRALMTTPRSDGEDNSSNSKRPPRPAAPSTHQRGPTTPAPLVKSNTMPSRPRRRPPGSTTASLVDSDEAQAPATSRPSTRSSVFDSLGGARPRRNSTNSAAPLLLGAAAAAAGGGGGAPGRASSGGGAAAATAAAAGRPPPPARRELSTQAWQDDRGELPSSAANDEGKPPSGASSSRPRRRGQQQQQQQQQEEEETIPPHQRQVAWDRTSSGPSSQR